MKRIVFGLMVGLAPVVWAQSSNESGEVPEIKAVVGAPFSGVGVQVNTRTTADGNSFVHTTTTHYYRDGMGRTRTEKEFPVPVAQAAGAADASRLFVTINDKVTGEIDTMFTPAKVASVVQRSLKIVDTPVAVPEIYVSFDGFRPSSNDPGWSATTSLGEKSIDGIHVVGSQRTYTVPAGKVGNQKPVTISVQQWSSPELGVIIDKLSKSSIGGQMHYQLTQVVQAEPDASLFKVPADFKKILVKPGTGNVVSVDSSAAQ